MKIRMSMQENKESTIVVKIQNTSSFPNPVFATAMSAGMDVRANIAEPLTLAPMQRVLVPTGLRVELPQGYEMQLRPRSGLALKHGITLLNSPGTIDADYRGEIGVILVNLGTEPFDINPGERICQMVIAKYQRIDWQNVQVLGSTERGEGGFGHTGKE